MKLIRCLWTTYVMEMLSGIFISAIVFTPYARADGFFFIERPKLGLDTSYEFEEEKRSLPNTETETTSHEMLEKVTIGTNGWVYHPNLMEYRLSFEPEWHQETYRKSQSVTDSTQTSKRDTSVLTYDGKTTLFKQKPCSLDIFASRNTQQIDLSSAQNSDIDSETWGTRFNFTNALLPVTIGFINRKVTQTGFYPSDEDRDEIQIKIRHNLKKSITELNVLCDDMERTTRSTWGPDDIASTATSTELTNTLFFAGDESVRLDSLLYLNQAEYDDVQMDTLMVSENFFWTYGKNLLTQSTFTFNRREMDDAEAEEKGLRVLLTHRLGDTLTTNLGAGASFNDFTGGSEEDYRLDLGFLYRRPIGGWGRVELGAAYDYGVTQRSGNHHIIPREERYVLSTATETFLEKQHVAIESILVTDTTGSIVYTENIDYRIEERGPDVRISRTLLGAIADGQQVTVHYSYQFDTGYDDSRFGQDYRFSLELWSLLYLTVTHGSIYQDILAGESLNDPQDDTYNTVRIRFDKKWSETRFEYENQDRKRGNSTVTKSVSELIHFRTFRFLSFNFSGHYGNREFTDSNEKETFYTLGADIGWTPKWWCTIRLICLRNGISGDQQDMHYTEIAPTVQWIYGVWTGTVSYRLRDQEDDPTGNSLWRQEVFLAVNRRLW